MPGTRYDPNPECAIQAWDPDRVAVRVGDHHQTDWQGHDTDEQLERDSQPNIVRPTDGRQHDEEDRRVDGADARQNSRALPLVQSMPDRFHRCYLELKAVLIGAPLAGT